MQRRHFAKCLPPVLDGGVFGDVLLVSHALRRTHDSSTAHLAVIRQLVGTIVPVNHEELLVAVFGTDVHGHRVGEVAVDLPGKWVMT